MREITNKSEKAFAEYLDSLGVQYIYQPKVLVLEGINYTPDFFVLQNSSFYEVIGTRQAFSQNKIKINLAQALVNLFIVNPNGTLYQYRTNTLFRRGKTVHELTYCNVDVAGFLHKELILPIKLANICGCSSACVTAMVRKERMKLTYLNKVAETYPAIKDFIYEQTKQIQEFKPFANKINAGDDNA